MRLLQPMRGSKKFEGHNFGATASPSFSHSSCCSSIVANQHSQIPNRPIYYSRCSISIQNYQNRLDCTARSTARTAATKRTIIRTPHYFLEVLQRAWQETDVAWMSPLVQVNATAGNRKMGESLLCCSSDLAMHTCTHRVFLFINHRIQYACKLPFLSTCCMHTTPRHSTCLHTAVHPLHLPRAQDASTHQSFHATRRLVILSRTLEFQFWTQRQQQQR